MTERGGVSWERRQQPQPQRTHKRPRDADNSRQRRAAPPTQQPGALSMEKLVLETLLHDVGSAADRFRRTRVHKPWEYQFFAKDSMAESEGERRVMAMQRALAYLDTQGFQRSKQQRVMHSAFMTCSFAQYYGDDIQRHLRRLLEQTGFSELRSEAMVLAPRRYGKTVSMAMWAACELATQPGHDILIYSNNHRASKMMLLQVFRILQLLMQNPDFGGQVLHLNKNESLSFRTRDGHVNMLQAYPAKPENLRGTGATRKTGTVILEEMAYIDLDLILEIVAPTLTRKGVKLLGITTVKGADSFVGPMAEAKFPDGRSVFLTLNFELICPECKRAGTPETCKCLVGDIPYWQSSAQHEKLAILMQGKIETFMKEIKGMSVDQTIMPAFDPPSVRWLQTPAAVVNTHELYSPEIFLAVDPACNGKYSKFAIMSAIFIDNRMVITGIDSVTNVPLNRQYETIVGHVELVRALHGLGNARVIFCPESNMPGEGVRITDDMARARMRNVIVLRENGGEPGVISSNSSKKQMWIAAASALNEHRIVFHPNMICANARQGHTPASMRDMLVKQLLGYQRKLVYKHGDSYSLPKEIFTGKIGGACDDHAIVMQLLYIARNVYQQKLAVYRAARPIYVRGDEVGSAPMPGQEATPHAHRTVRMSMR